MLTFTAAGPLPPYNDYAAGYYRPGRVAREFVPLVTGCPTEKEAIRQAMLLAEQRRELEAPPAVPHHLRTYGRGAFAVDLELE